MKRSVLSVCLMGLSGLLYSGAAQALPPPTVTSVGDSEITPTARWYNGQGTQWGGTPMTGTDSLIMESGYYFATFYDQSHHLCLARKHVFSFPTDPWLIITFAEQVPPGGDATQEDSHDWPAVGVSSDGRIHLCYGQHNELLRYRLSSAGAATVADGSFTTALFGAEVSVLPGGVTAPNITYPMFIKEETSGKLHMFWRDTIYKTYMTTYQGSGTWGAKRELTDGSSQTYTDPDGLLPPNSRRRPYITRPGTFGNDIHLHWMWREQRSPASSLAHDHLFTTSTDSGVTWKNTGGTTQTLPMRLNHNVVGFNSPPLTGVWTQINGGVTAVDSQGNTHVVVRHGESATVTTQRNWHYARTGTTWTRTMIPGSASFDPGLFIDRRTKVDLGGTLTPCDTVYVTTRQGGRLNIMAAQRLADTGESDWDKWTQIYLSPAGVTYGMDMKGRIGGAGHLNLLGHRSGGSAEWSSLRHLKVNIDTHSD